MKIVVCDDDRIWREKAEQILFQYLNEVAPDADVFCFPDGERLLADDGLRPDIAFLDIEMQGQGQDGISVAKAVNEKWPSCQIVYLTNYLSYATEVYQTEHAYFVVKQEFERRLPEVFRKILHEMQQTARHLIFRVIGNGDQVFAPAEILYFERRGRDTFLTTARGVFRMREKLGDLGRRLPEIEFVRCGESYIVYLPAMEQMERNAFVMKDGANIPISRSYQEKVRLAFLRWARLQQ